MYRDAHGLELTCASQEAADAFDHVIDGYLRNRNDTSQRLKACLAADPGFCMAHMLRGVFAMLSFNRNNHDYARKCLDEALRTSANASERERAHVTALKTWIDGDIDRLMATWESISEQWPRDVLAFRLHHFQGFWLGRPEAMLSRVERVLPHWSRDLPGFGAVLACRAFAHEECGSYIVAENAGRMAVEIDSGDIWATHAIAHVYEMQGRASEGLALYDALEGNWDGGNNLLHHLWWHQSMFHVQRGESDLALQVYDRKFRNLDSELTQQMPDLYIDMQNAISMLYRLELAELDVGERWEELAAKAQERGADCCNPFTLPHWMLALVRTGRMQAADDLIQGMEEFAQDSGTLAPVVRNAALPICRAMKLAAQKDHQGALDVMRPALSCMHQLGGSHAQHDVLERFFAETAMHARSANDIRLVLERVRGRWPVAPEHRALWRAVAAAA